MVMMRCRERDSERLALFPSLDYKGLYSTLLQFLDLMHVFQNGLYDFGKAFLNTLVSLVPFLERELIDTLPYVVASTLINFPRYLYLYFVTLVTLISVAPRLFILEDFSMIHVPIEVLHSY